MLGRRSSVAAAAGLAVLLGSLYCRAEPVRFRYSAPAECPGQDVFLERVRAHTERLELAEPTSLARVLEVRIQKRRGGFVARLEFVDARQERISREIVAKVCGEATEALALAAALLVETEPAHEPDEPVPLPGSGPAPPTELARPSAPRIPERVSSPPPPPRSPRSAVWSLGFSGRVSSQLAPDPAYGPAVGLSRFQPLDPEGNDLASGWRTTFDLSYQDSGPVTFEETSVRFRFLGVRSALCGALTLRTPVFAELCAAGEVGYWHARAERSVRLDEAHSGAAVWGALGVPVAFGVALDQLRLFLSAGPWFPLNRRRFTFSGPDSVVHEVKTLSVSLDLGLRLAF